MDHSCDEVNIIVCCIATQFGFRAHNSIRLQGCGRLKENKVSTNDGLILTVEPQTADPTFVRSARVNGTCTTYGLKYINIYI